MKQMLLVGVVFPMRFVEQVMVCAKSPKFSIMLCGSPCGFFGASIGLSQGDSMSSLLFALF